jgi:hypothetical protein
MLPAKFGFIWPSSFRGEDFLNISQSETSIALGQLGQMEPNLAERIYIRSSIKILHFVSFRQQIWPPRAMLVSDWLMLKKSSPLKLLGQMEPNLAGSIYVRSSIKLLHLTTDGRRTPSDGNTSHDPLGQVS